MMAFLRFELKKMLANKLLRGILLFTLLFVCFIFYVNRAMQIQVRQDLFDNLHMSKQSSAWDIEQLFEDIERGRHRISLEETEQRLAASQLVYRALNDAESALRANENDEYLTQLLLYQERARAYRDIGGSPVYSAREFQENELLYPALLAGGFHYENLVYSSNWANFLVVFLSRLFHPLGLSLFVIAIGLLFAVEYDNQTIRFLLVESESRVKWLRVSGGLNVLLFLLVLFLSILLALGVSFLWNHPLIGNHVNDFDVPVEVFVNTGLIVTAREKLASLLLMGIPLFLLLFSLFYFAVSNTKSSIKGLLLYAILVGTGVGVTEYGSLLKKPWNPFSYFDHSWVSAHDSYSFIGRGVVLVALASGFLFYLSQRRLVRKPL